MKKVALILSVFALISSSVFAQNASSPYAGEQERSIKALSSDQVKAYFNGEGMGLAKAAELNHYPGPKHVLELNSELNLSDEQRIKTQEVYRAMHERAVSLGKQIVEKEKELDHLFGSGIAHGSHVLQKVQEIAKLQGELRYAHLEAHVKMRQILSIEQREKYDHLRGYATGGESESHRHQHKHTPSH